MNYTTGNFCGDSPHLWKTAGTSTGLLIWLFAECACCWWETEYNILCRTAAGLCVPCHMRLKPAMAKGKSGEDLLSNKRILCKTLPSVIALSTHEWPAVSV